MNPTPSGLAIVLSAGGDLNELAAHGLGIEHINELMVRIAMSLLRSGHRLAFGGTLAAQTELTSYLIEVATSWVAEEAAKECDVRIPGTWPLVNYSAWPYYLSISEEQKAKLVGICRFVNVDPPKEGNVDPVKAAENGAKSPEARLLTSGALSEMRDLSTVETDFRIVWGGKIVGAAGWMAGILEEVSCSLKHGKPVLILGGFGGCARIVADFLAAPDAPWPAQLSLVASADAQRDAILSPDQRIELDKRFERIKQQLVDYRIALYTKDTANGVSCDLLKQALIAETSRDVIQLVSAAVRQYADSRRK